jgi:hypothetical protein
LNEGKSVQQRGWENNVRASGLGERGTRQRLERNRDSGGKAKSMREQEENNEVETWLQQDKSLVEFDQIEGRNSIERSWDRRVNIYL